MSDFTKAIQNCNKTVAVLPWGHTLKLMQKLGNDDDAILYYAQESVTKGWSRSLLTSAISMQMHLRKDEHSDNNFGLTLPESQNELKTIIEFLVRNNHK